MSGRLSYHEEARRQQLDETNPPPPYSEAVNAVAVLPPNGGPTATSHPTGPSGQNTPPLTARLEQSNSLEWEISDLRLELELQRAERICLDCGKTLAEPATEVGTVGSTANSAHSLGLTEGTESHERKIIKMQVKTILAGRRTNKLMERIIQRKGDKLKSIATRLVIVEAELERRKQREEAELARKKQPWEVEEVTHLGIIQSGGLIETVFEVFQRLLGL